MNQRIIKDTIFVTIRGLENFQTNILNFITLSFKHFN